MHLKESNNIHAFPFVFYAFQVIQSGDPKANEIVLSNMIALLDRVFLDVTVGMTSGKYHVYCFHNGNFYLRICHSFLTNAAELV